jgi:hypothetical protein
MRNLLILFVLSICLWSCNNSNTPRANSFEDVDGLLYFEPPETGSVVFLVFLPAKRGSKINVSDLDFNNYREGMKFITVNRQISKQLYRSNFEITSIKGRNQRIYIIPKAKIYYHIEKNYEGVSLVSELQCDTLVYRGKNISISHYYNYVELDSIKINRE